MSELPKRFEKYLTETQKVSRKTLRDYRADVSHFSAWAILHLKSSGVNISGFDSLLPHLSARLVANYKGYHLENGLPESTTNRRLSSLRNLSRFLLGEGLITEDPTRPVSNLRREPKVEEKLGAVLEEFKRHLQKDGVSQITLKNYISDVRHFLAWSVGLRP